MKLRFKHQSFQDDAVNSVCDVFSGQRKTERTFQVDSGNALNFDEIGFGNGKITLNDEQIRKNLNEVQLHSHIPANSGIEKLDGKIVLTVNMETGTGKTFTYIKTMYELNAQYGWSKFIIVVPSIAIREGVAKTFESTREYFVSEYGKNITAFVYNSSRLSEIDHFSNDPGINVMIINTQAFNSTGKDARRIYEEIDSFRSRRPIDVIAATNPIVIIDEPQSVLGTDKNANKTRESVQNFNPLFFVNYSATHRENFNQVYRLDAVDAYQKRLVKKITVKGISVKGRTATNGYLYLQRINVYSNKKPDATVTFEMDTADGNGVRRITKILRMNDNLYDISKNLEEYRNNYIISEINARDGVVRFSNDIELHVGQVIGDTTEDDIRRIQIRETIHSHLRKERELYKKGIKVLSLFFIDEVAKYKKYDESGSEQPGEYWKIFEEEYEREIELFMQELPFGEDNDYREFLNGFKVSKTHNGYFSIDKKGHAINSEVKRNETESSDTEAYDLIMKNKERLLSFDEPTRFIFSHSALREGWDNPNVFQICTLRESNATIKKKQEIGRGLRLCVDKDGNRMDEEVLGPKAVQEVNELVVVANESYETFAKALQSEFDEELESRPKFVDANLFANQSFTDAGNNETLHVDSNTAAVIYVGLLQHGITDKDGQISPEFRELSEAEKIAKISEAVGPDLEKWAYDINKVLDYVYDPKANPIITDARKNNAVLNINREKYDSKAFKELWEHINEKTYYTVDFDDDELISKAVSVINSGLTVTQTHVTITEGYLKDTGQDSVEMQKLKGKDVVLEEVTSSNVKYDLVGRVAEKTKLTRKAVVEILTHINADKFELFKKNPEEFIQQVSKIINSQKATTVVEHITYDKTGEKWNAEEIFIDNEITGDYSKNVIDTPNKHLYDKLRFDSSVESKFAEELETKDDIELYVKLPSGFYITTPMGRYNPDWAIAFKEGSVKHIYFVAETKGEGNEGLLEVSLRGVERAKIECAKKHFAKISDDTVKYGIVDSFDELYKRVTE